MEAGPAVTMRMARIVPGVALALALVAASSNARAVDLTGNVGGGYARSDAWSGSQHASSTSWDYEGDVALSGAALRPGLFDWLVGANYRALRTMQYQGFERTEAWGLLARTSLLGGTPVPVSLSASRTWTDFVTDTGTTHTGESVINTYGGTGALIARGYPGLRVSANHVDTHNVSLGGISSSTGTENLAVGLAHAVSNHTYQLDYATSWNRGTYEETNYHSHYLTAYVTSAPTETTRYRINEHYYLRDPTTEAWNNPRYEDGTLSTGVQWRPDTRLTASLDYTYRHLLVRVLGQPSVEDLGHILGSSAYYRISPHVATYGNVAATYEHQVGNRGEFLNTSQFGGAGVNWNDTFGHVALSAGAGATAGVVEPSGAEMAGTYGATAGAGAGYGYVAENMVMQTNATYAGSFMSSSAAGLGWKLDQRLLLAADEIVNQKIALRQMLTGSITQQDGGMLGALRSRAASISSAIAWKAYSASVSAGASDSLSEALAEPTGTLPPNGLGASPPATPTTIPLGQQFNTYTLFATVTTTETFGKLRFMQLARTLRISAPARDPQWERALAFTASYEIGAFYLSLDEHYSVGGMGSIAQKANIVMLRLTRTFGARF